MQYAARTYLLFISVSVDSRAPDSSAASSVSLSRLLGCDAKGMISFFQENMNDGSMHQFQSLSLI